MSKILIRGYKRNDKKYVLELIDEYNKYHFSKNPFKNEGKKPGLTKYLTQKLVENVHGKNGKIFFASLDDKIVGLIGVFFIKQSRWEAFETEEMTVGYISKFFVLKEFRGKKIGSMLMKKAEEYLKNKGATHIRLFVSGSNKNAQFFYDRKGYKAWNIEMIKKI